ncbi:hypothetical protein [Acidiphilium sp.]|uniref:hypothetical protein n=1 Tax=Acidiphilium sp. TaxID=527 RepID=UPI0025865641|nr:hypothetical protein [Acidiphilium sp.]
MRLALLAASAMLAITLASATKAQPEHVWADGFFPNLATQTEFAAATLQHKLATLNLAAAHPPAQAQLG